jgi:hypothetical protein
MMEVAAEEVANMIDAFCQSCPSQIQTQRLSTLRSRSVSYLAVNGIGAYFMFYETDSLS